VIFTQRDERRVPQDIVAWNKWKQRKNFLLTFISPGALPSNCKRCFHISGCCGGPQKLAFKPVMSFMLRVALIIFAMSFAAVIRANEQPPNVPTDVVLKPTFMTGYDPFSGGTAFLCNIPGVEGTFLLTAQHLFGPACGLKRQFSWQEVPKTFVVATALSITEPTHFVISSNCIAIPGAGALDNRGYDKDLAAYRLSADQKPASLRLASARPKVGETVFLHARQRGKMSLDMLRAVVRKSTDSEFEYAFEDKQINLGGTSGAPVLNTAGEVVALNIGGGEEAGRCWGMGTLAIPYLASLRSRLSCEKGIVTKTTSPVDDLTVPPGRSAAC
jgi:hypothetical protein